MNDPIARLVVGAMALACIAALLLFSCRPAAAPQFCMPWNQLRDHLADTFQEVTIGGGAMGQTYALRVFAGPDGKSFTIVVIGADNLACIVAAGSDWEIADPPPAIETKS